MFERKLRTKGKLRDTSTGYDFTLDKALPPRQAMRKKCLECVNLIPNDVKTCDITDCTLWPYRMGHGTTSDPDGNVVVNKARSESQIAADARLGKARKGLKVGS